MAEVWAPVGNVPTAPEPGREEGRGEDSSPSWSGTEKEGAAAVGSGREQSALVMSWSFPKSPLEVGGRVRTS